MFRFLSTCLQNRSATLRLWLDALLALHQRQLTPENLNDTLGVLLKYQDDIEQVGRTPDLVP